MFGHAFSRRSFLGSAAAGVLGSIISLPGGPAQVKRLPKRLAKNIIFCVSDGMSMGVPTMVNHMLMQAAGQTSFWTKLSERPDAVNGFMDTCSLSSMVTDSAAASSAWGSGSRVLNGAINTLPGVELTPLYEVLKGEMLRGLVTTATITHATPSGFAVAVRSRSAEPVIARQYLEREVDVLMGGGQEFFDPSLRSDKEDVYAAYDKAGYSVWKTRDELMAGNRRGRALGVFNRGQMPFTIDRNNSEEIARRTPTLTEMSEAALQILSKGRSGFILQIEGARIDHAAHPNDLGAILNDQLEFEQAVKAAVEFADNDGETLVVVTSDHGNANPGITGAAGFGAGNGLFLLSGMKSSYEAMGEELKAAKTPAAVQELVEAKLGIKLSAESAQAVAASADGKSPVASFGNYRFPTAVLSMALGTHTGVGWTSGSHTSDWTMTTAIGPGRELFAGVVRNDACFGKLLLARGLEFRNPSMTLQEARAAEEKESGKLQAALRDAAESEHWV